jgi:bifunctional non-homologous end joining protein LigD
MSLKAYAKKRDFKKTAEPRGKVVKGKGHRFVIQKHAASRLHYDFRLEIDGTLKSWAVPKGIPFAHGEKRLAVHVEDHPVSYIDFEGTIPKGQYGGGTVMVWDRGTFAPDSDDPSKDLAAGKLHFTLKGKKLKGAWYLVRIRDPEDNQWLLIRGGDDMTPVSAKQDDTSVLSGKSMKALGESDRVWESKPASAKPRKTKSVAGPAKAKARSSRRAAPLKFVEPMKARLVAAPPAGDWTYEIKFDGFRALALKNTAGTQLLSRNEKDLGEKFPEVADAVAALDVDDAIIDGEIVALDDKGRSSFQLLQAYELGDARPPLHYYVFDLLRLNGESLVNLPLAERKARLKKLIGRKTAGVIRFSASLGSDADALLKQAKSVGLEGLIGKRTDSTYETGRRSGAWIKLKLHHEQEFVIGGYTPPGGSRTHFGALLIGVREGKKLLFTAKVGTGFNHTLLRTLHARFQKLLRDKCPFDNLPETKTSRYGQTITASVMKTCRWLKPVLVCQVRFSEWTRDGSLRQPVFLGLREDKDAAEVVREKAAA